MGKISKVSFDVESGGRPWSPRATHFLTTHYFPSVGAMDLAMEGEILSRLDHTNIIKLHGVSQHTSKTAYTETENGYFLVLDILEETLRHRLYELKRTCLSDASNKDNELRTTSSSHHLLASIGPIALGIANGLSYMHSKGVVLRDIKPDNIGFDADGTPKIFDFGFAREVHTLSPNEMAGSFRYMAPEVGQRKGATLSSDVYSFGVLLWEICSLRTPFKHVKTCDEFLDEVMIGGWRESTAAIPSRVLRELIEQCWDTDPGKRPPMKTVHKILKQEFAKYKLKSPREATASASLARNGSSPGLLTRENSAASLEGRWRFGSRRSRQSSWSDRSDACIPTSSSHGRSSTNSKVKNAVWKMLNPLEGKRRSRSNESFGHSNSTASFGSSGRTLE
jgi:serine/threonine protein kinase